MSSQVALVETVQGPQPPENVTIAGCAPVFSAPLLVAPKNSPGPVDARRACSVSALARAHPPPGALGFGGGAGFGSVGPGVGRDCCSTTTLTECEPANAFVTVLFERPRSGSWLPA